MTLNDFVTLLAVDELAASGPAPQPTQLTKRE
jgi:hypothetical protein